MPTESWQTLAGAGGRRVRLGLLRLTDAAPVVLARAAGLFAAEGLDVTLSVEPSWANLADKLAYGLIDAAVMLPPLALAMAAGARAVATPLRVPMAISLNGNAVTLSEALAGPVLAPDGADDGPLAVGRRFRQVLAGRRRPVLAVVHAWSTHDLLLRYWLAASGIDPDRDLDLIVVPPAEMVQAMADGRIDGFCAGAPWGEMAVRAGLGRTVVKSSAIWRNHPEKCLAVRAAWADADPLALQGVLRALLKASARCDAPEATAEIAALLADPACIGVPADAIAASLPGGAEGAVDRSLFAAHAATFPWRSHALWFLGQMARWRRLPPGIDAATLARRVYRPDLYVTAAHALGLPVPLADRKVEGGHDAPWELPAEPASVAMRPDGFCDGARFDPEIIGPVALAAVPSGEV